MDGVFSQARLSELIGMIYDAALRPERWFDTIDTIRRELNFENAALGLQALPSGETLLNVTANIPTHYAERMADYGADVVEQWGGAEVLGRLPMSEPHVLSRVNPGAGDFSVTTSRYTLEWGQPQGLTDVLAIALVRDERGLGSLAFGRHISRMPIREAEIENARLLIPHLQRAAEISRLLDIAELVRSTFEATLDSLSVPVMLVTSELALVHANPRARDLLDAGDMLRMGGGRLAATSQGVGAALSAAVSDAESDESGIGRKGLGIPAARADGTVVALHVLPLRPSRTAAAPSAAAAIFVAQANAPRAAPAELVSSLFGLTPAETRVFEQIAGGRTVAETAAGLGIGISTAKTHLARLFEKTGSRRQAELVQLAASLAPPVA